MVGLTAKKSGVDPRHTLRGSEDGFVEAYQSVGERLVNRLKIFRKRVLQVFPDESHSSTAEWILNRAAIEASQLNSVEPGGTAIVFCYNNPHLAPVFLALLCLGIVCVPINHNTPSEELFPILGNLKPNVMLCLEQHAEPLKKVYSDCPIMVIGKNWDTPAREIRTVPIENLAEEPAFYFFTTGTTGIPKKHSLTHALFTVALNSFRRQDSDLQEDDIMVTLAAPHWYFGLLLQVLTMDLGYKIVIPASFSMDSFCHLVALYDATVIFLMPAQVFAMCKSPEMQPSMLSTVRMAVLTGSVLNGRAQKYVEDHLRVPTVQWYGSTEMQIVSSTSSVGDERPPFGSVGKVRCWASAMVVNTKGFSVKPYAEGELLFKGPYLANDIESGWFQTGDIGYYDNSDYLYVLESKRNVIITRGVHVFPSHLELLLMEHPCVLEAAVTALPRRGEGFVITALVVPRHPVNPKDLQTFVEGNTPHKAMHLKGGVFLVRAIPKTTAGKVKRSELPDLCQKRLAESIRASRMGKNPSKDFRKIKTE